MMMMMLVEVVVIFWKEAKVAADTRTALAWRHCHICNATRFAILPRFPYSNAFLVLGVLIWNIM